MHAWLTARNIYNVTSPLLLSACTPHCHTLSLSLDTCTRLVRRTHNISGKCGLTKPPLIPWLEAEERMVVPWEFDYHTQHGPL